MTYLGSGGTQDNWRRCGKCQSLFYAGATPSACVAGGAHSSTGSVNYLLHYGSHPFGGQSGWSLCVLCGVLFNPYTGNRCPFTGRAHAADPKIGYSLNYGDEPDRLTADKPMQSVTRLRSRNKHFTMVVQADGQFVVLNFDSSTVWSSNTGGHPGTTNTLVMQKDGNLVLTGPSGKLWQSATGGRPAADNYLLLQDDGNLVAFNPSGGVIWATGAYRSDYAGQDDWRYCRKCGNLFFNGSGKPGPCLGGGSHIVGDSNNYGLNYVSPDVPQTAVMPQFANGTFFIQMKHSRRFFDVAGGSTAPGAAIIQWDFHGGPNQQFRFDEQESGYYAIVPMSSAAANLCFDISGGSTAHGAALTQWNRGAALGPNQTFQIRGRSDGWYSIYAKHSGQVMSIGSAVKDAGTGVIQWEWGGGDEQAVRFISAWMPPQGVVLRFRNVGHNQPFNSELVAQLPGLNQKSPHDSLLTIIDAGGQKVYLRDYAGRNLGTRQDGSIYLTTNASGQEQWFIEPTGEGTYLLRSGQFAGLRLGQRMDTSLYAANKTTAWEQWTISKIYDSPAFTMPPRMGGYDWQYVYAFPEAGRGTLSFVAQASNDVFIGLAAAGSVIPLYEMVIGGANNTRSEFRLGPEGPAAIINSGNLAAPGGSNRLWVSIDKLTGLIQVGRGNPGEQVLLSYLEPNLNLLATVQNASFSSWNTPIQYSEVTMSAGSPGITVGQPGWRICGSCGGMWNAAQGNGRCVTGRPHEALGDGFYVMPTACQWGTVSQKGWRSCSKCLVAFLANSDPGPCPAGGMHDDSASVPLFVPLGSFSSASILDGWCRCTKCQLLVTPKTQYVTPCAAGGLHNMEGPYYAPQRSNLLAPDAIVIPDKQIVQGQSFTLPQPGKGVISFSAQGPNDANLFISTAQGALVEGYQICVGGSGNTKSWIARAGADAIVSCNKGLLNPGGANPLWVSLNKQTGTIQVGRGAPGQDVILSFTDPQFVAEAQYVFFTAWDRPMVFHNISISAVDLPQPYVDTKCKLVVDYDAAHKPVSQIEVLLTARAASGATDAGAKIDVYAQSALTVSYEAGGARVTRTIDAANGMTLTMSSVGRCRFTITVPADKLSLPLIKVRSEKMAALGKWLVFSADRDLHLKLSQLTVNQLLSPTGMPSPFTDAAQANKLATGLSTAITALMNPSLKMAADDIKALGITVNVVQAPAQMYRKDFLGIGGAINSAVSWGVSQLTSAAQAAIDAAAAAAQQAANQMASATSTVINTMSSQLGSPLEKCLDVFGSAAQTIIQNKGLALPRTIEDFAANCISGATQLAIDFVDGVMVYALIVENGVNKLVKAAISDIQSATLTAVAFIKRAGLVAKQVIDLLASLLDWVAIVALQGQLQDFLDGQWNAFPATIAEQRPLLAGRIQTLQQITAPSISTSTSLAIPFDITLLGGPFGFLMDKVGAYFGNYFSNIASGGLGDLQPVLNAFRSISSVDLQTVRAAFMSSALHAMLQNPTQLLSMSPSKAFELVQPLIAMAWNIIGQCADAVLAAAPILASALRVVMQQRLDVPVLTDLIENVIFLGKRTLSLESLLSLMGAALLHTMRTLSSAGVVSFADDEAILGGFQMIACILNQLVAMAAAGATIYWNNKAGETAVGKFAALVGFYAAVVAVPRFVPTTSVLCFEQWFTWGLNLIGSIAGLVDGFTPPDGNDDAKLLASFCGVGMIFATCICNSSAIQENKGDITLAKLDLASQLVGAVNPFFAYIPDDTGVKLPINAAANGAAAALAAATVNYTNAHPDAELG